MVSTPPGSKKVLAAHGDLIRVELQYWSEEITVTPAEVAPLSHLTFHYGLLFSTVEVFTIYWYAVCRLLLIDLANSLNQFFRLLPPGCLTLANK